MITSRPDVGRDDYHRIESRQLQLSREMVKEAMESDAIRLHVRSDRQEQRVLYDS